MDLIASGSALSGIPASMANWIDKKALMSETGQWAAKTTRASVSMSLSDQEAKSASRQTPP
jgi:hypothetical protein